MTRNAVEVSFKFALVLRLDSHKNSTPGGSCTPKPDQFFLISIKEFNALSYLTLL